ncbi:thioredoxin family protein [Candidatus Woesearchaeota archaeon]|nr:thioredoxin family protein [Candidatus Woesearchaeota archaeon]
MIKPGDSIPYFELGGVDDDMYTPDSWDGKKVLVVIFSCNHCPYAQAYEERLVALQKHFGIQGVQFVMINSNDSAGYPDDSFINMKARSKKEGFNFPYLRDRSQVVARKFGAECTPETFVFDKHRVCMYHGRIDDSWRDASAVKEHTLKDAISDVLAGNVPVRGESPALGCGIKWK